MCEQNRELCFYCVWYIVGRVSRTACGPGPVDDTKWPQSFPKHDGLFYVPKSALRSLLRAITDQPHVYEKRGSNNL